jgi:uncharacterized protein with HEPN domain
MQMRDHAADAIEACAGRRRPDLEKDMLLRHALTHLVEIVGKAANRVPLQAREAHPAIPWAEIIGMRRRLAHGYDEVNLDVLWATVKEDLPALMDDLDAILGL